MKNKEAIQQKQENELVAIVNQSGVELGVEKVLQKNIALIPHTIEIERIKASAGFYVSNREDLMKLDNSAKLQMLYGILKEAIVGCEAGIDYDIVPFKGKPTIIRKKEGWFKVLDLIKPAEIVRFVSNVITKGDEYSFNPVTEELHHELKGDRSQKYEDIIGAYAYVRLANGFEKTSFLSKEDLDLIKKISPSGSSEYSPWNSNAIRMCKTKVTKELAKDLFTLFSGRVNSTLANAIESDEKAVKRIDEKGHIINDEAIYDDKPIEQVEPSDFEPKKEEVKLSEL
ncbi:MAG: recombinase RecT [Bacilli bacterium]|jgi:phage RecT family recombinase